MFRKLMAIVFIIALFGQAKLSWSENYNFRYTKWGMTADEVIASESKLDPIEKSENLIKYKTQILGKHVELIYLFAQNKLIGSSYKLDDNYLNSQHFINTRGVRHKCHCVDPGNRGHDRSLSLRTLW